MVKKVKRLPARTKAQSSDGQRSLTQDEEREHQAYFAAFETPYGQILLDSHRNLDMSNPDVRDDLLFLESRFAKEGTRFDALLLVQVAGRLNLPPPPWAAAEFNRVIIDRLEGRVPSLDEGFGFSASGKGKHKNAPAYQTALRKRNEMLALDVHKLRTLGVTVDMAAKRVAMKLRDAKGWNRTVYDLEPIQPHGDLERRIRDIYYAWRKQNMSLVTSAQFTELIRSKKREILASLPIV